LPSATPAAPTVSDEFPSGPLSFWGAPVQTGPPHEAEDEAEAEDEVGQDDLDAVTAPTLVPSETEIAPEHEAPEGEFSEGEAPVGEFLEHEAPEGEVSEGEVSEGEVSEGKVSADDAVVTPDDEPSAEPDREPLVAVVDREPVTDIGRHARIDVEEPAPSATALRLPLDDPTEIPEGYPIKADTGSGMYWAPGSADYDEAPAEIWFASEEMARTNGFVRGD